MKKVLTIAGSDCSGGAGIQADIKTMTAHKVYAMSVITALTAQNTTGVYGVLETDPAFVAQQLDCIFQDIMPDAIKIGMVSSADIITVIAEKLIQYHAANIVVDPVMIATSGSRLLNDNAMSALVNKLLPLADIITPNIPEAQALGEQTIQSTADMLSAAQNIARLAPGAVLIKGGHLPDTADDLLFAHETSLWLQGERIANPNTHGTGCTLSSAITCGLAEGYSMECSVRNAKAYITGALKAGLNFGNGRGPLDHCWCM